MDSLAAGDSPPRRRTTPPTVSAQLPNTHATVSAAPRPVPVRSPENALTTSGRNDRFVTLASLLAEFTAESVKEPNTLTNVSIPVPIWRVVCPFHNAFSNSLSRSPQVEVA